ncbi:DUF2716 domain-containing protein [Streptomyces cinnabarinus]|uniref:DUF2716 domain-containing protein n=1 Tax=Streptomyces cinnabarinus TaxID=67287 RepID=A0ABY7KPX0_9ACTN|nr:DUF2716 domain-containing protein [Streptomyces cinnabarinus]WAZ25608.1 DUF2716 domain-containing protein [Streptomyces cinnabarinus]
MTADASALWAMYDTQIRGRVPEVFGVVAERDGPLVRVHYGTHGVVDHGGLSEVEDLAVLVRRSQEDFAERVEPVTWKAYSHDGPRLAQALLDAGFTTGTPRSLLMADVADVPTTDVELRTYWAGLPPKDQERIRRLAEAAPEQRRPVSELEFDMDVLSLWDHHRLLDLVWLEKVHGTDFSSIGAISGPRPELLHAAAAWAGRRVWSRPSARYVVAEASGDLVPVHLAAGFQEIAEVTTYRWAPPGEPARERPSKQLFSDPEHDEIWQRFEKRFEVTYETAYDGIAEPPGSVTWHMEAVEHWRDPLLRRVEAAIARGLKACGRRGDRLYRLKWYINGTVCDPTRVGGPGQPPWPGYSYLTDENVIQVSGDLRMGTYGNFREESLCVFGAELVAEVEEELTELLGTVLRRDGRPVGNVWTFGP